MKLLSLALTFLAFASFSACSAPANTQRAEIRFGKGVDPEAATRKLRKIILPKVDFRDATVRKAMEFLNQRAKALEPENTNPGGILTLEPDPKVTNPGVLAGGVVFDPGVNLANRRLTFTLNNVSLLEVMKYVAALCDCDIEFRGESVVMHIVPKKAK